MKNNKHRVLFLSHGGGPLPLLGDEGHSEMVATLRVITARIKKPSAVIVISAHWEEIIPTVTSASNPSLIYDYYGFPEESYDIQYPCPGEPLLATQVHQLLNSAGIDARLDERRGFDHGLFVPLKIMYPEADIPCIQLSLVKRLDPAEHISIGKAIAGIKHDELLIIGSGFSFHNLRAFFAPVTNETRIMNESFEQWLIDTCSNTSIDEDERTRKLVNWEQAPYARYCHPREEHLLPLHVCYGVTQTACNEYYELSILNKKSSVYLW
ncbi:MAG: dioxygenase [Gammaproteobacteria bacterium]|nr:dioxygenase [Gammaproteobacteria bacterium]